MYGAVMVPHWSGVEDGYVPTGSSVKTAMVFCTIAATTSCLRQRGWVLRGDGQYRHGAAALGQIT